MPYTSQNSKIQLHHFFVHTLFCPATTTLPTFIFKYKPYTYIMQILSSKLGHCIFQQGPRKKWQIRRFRFHFFTTEQDQCVRSSAQHFLVGHTVVRLSLRPRINRRRRRPFIRILGSARVQMQVILLFKNKFIRIFCLLEAISRKKLSQNSCSGFAFIPKRKDS